MTTRTRRDDEDNDEPDGGGPIIDVTGAKAYCNVPKVQLYYFCWIVFTFVGNKCTHDKEWHRVCFKKFIIVKPGNHYFLA